MDFQNEIVILISDNGWLTDSIVNAVQLLFKKESTYIRSTMLLLDLQWNFEVKAGEFIQILHNDAGHWIAISTIGEKHPVAKIFD